MSKLAQRLEKLSETSPDIDTQYLIEALSQCPENTWFAPTASNNHFFILSELSDYALVAKMIIPNYKDGNCIGKQFLFYYNNDLDYSNIKK